MAAEDNAFRKAALAAWERERFVLGKPVDLAHLATDLNSYYGAIGLNVRVNPSFADVVDEGAKLAFRLDPANNSLEVHVSGWALDQWAPATSLANIGRALVEGPPTARKERSYICRDCGAENAPPVGKVCRRCGCPTTHHERPAAPAFPASLSPSPGAQPKVVPPYTPEDASAEALASIASSLVKISEVLQAWEVD